MDKSQPSRTSSHRRRTLGALGEDLVAERMTDAGWRVIARNWRSSDPLVRGELDLVVIDPEDRSLVFVEVKTRRSHDAFGGPLAAVTRTKQAKLRELGTSFLRETSVRAPTIRFDVVAVVVTGSRGVTVEHVRGAF